MSDNIKPVELSAEELDNVAGGAFSFVDADNDNRLDHKLVKPFLVLMAGLALPPLNKLLHLIKVCTKSKQLASFLPVLKSNN